MCETCRQNETNWWKPAGLESCRQPETEAAHGSAPEILWLVSALHRSAQTGQTMFQTQLNKLRELLKLGTRCRTSPDSEKSLELLN